MNYTATVAATTTKLLDAKVAVARNLIFQLKSKSLFKKFIVESKVVTILKIIYV
jgi:hypothetical protein